MYIVELRNTLNQRKRHRELQSAMYGISADPSITIELEYLTWVVRSLDVLIGSQEPDYNLKRRIETFMQRNLGMFVTIELDEDRTRER